MIAQHGTWREQGATPDLPRRLRALVEGHIDAGLTRGMQLYIARHGVPLLHEAWGVRGQDEQPITTRTRFALYSISKPITATALHLLVQRGEVGYDDPVVRFVPEFGQHGKHDVTVAHLLLHQAGIADLEDAVPPATYADFPAAIAQICALAPEAAAGDQTIYHVRTGAAMVAEIIQRVSGQGLREFCAAEVFGPLGMSRTTFGLPIDLEQDATDTVAGSPERAGVADLWRSREARQALHPAIGVHSTAQDLGAFYTEWLDALEGRGRLLSAETAAAATSVHAPAGGTAGFGYGFIVGVDPANPGSRGALCSARTFGHPGMCSTQTYADPEVGLVLVLLANVDPGQDVSDHRFAELCDTVQRAVR